MFILLFLHLVGELLKNYSLEKNNKTSPKVLMLPKQKKGLNQKIWAYA